MRRLSVSIVLVGVALARTAGAADLIDPVPTGRFSATCEDLGALCFADACGRDQITAAQGCQALCPSAVILAVVPSRCPISDRAPIVVLRRRG